MGKTWRDDKVLSRHKKGSREAVLEMDLRTRVKPLTKKKKGGGKNKTKEIVDEYINDLASEWEDEQYLLDEDY